MTTFSLARIARTVKYGETHSQAREEDGEEHPESGGNQIVCDRVDGRKFHCLNGLIAFGVSGCR